MEGGNMKTHINSSELALLMNIKPEEAKGKIIYCLNHNSPELDSKFPKVDIKIFQEKHKIDLEPYLNDVWSNFFTRHQTKGWVMDYPRKKIWHGKDKPFPKTIRLPRSLSGLISPKVLGDIKEAWVKKYTPILPSGVEIEFKP